MILERFYLGCLSQASFLIGDEETKTAVVVDPRRDIEVYLDRSAELGLTIRHVLLTHFHADFLSGHLELREATGASIHLGSRARAQYACEPMKDGSSLELGELKLVFLETPGHTPESVSILVYDRAKSASVPHAVLTGDTLFLGDVGRPDLMASRGETADELAGMLYDSLHTKILPLPDETLVYPGHGAGSACGKNLSSDSCSTLGVQRKTNYALQPMTRAEFVRLVTADQPEAPAYFSYDAELNRSERPTLERVIKEVLRPLSLEQVLELARSGAQLLDTRDADAYAREHLRGALNIGLGGRYASWAGTVLDPARPVVIVADPDKEEESALRLGRIGFDRIAGYLRGGMASASGRKESLVRGERTTTEELARAIASDEPPLVVDVRTQAEWLAGHIDGALHEPLIGLAARLENVPRGRKLVCVCKSGYRSSLAASLFERSGFESVTDLAGGMDAWQAASTSR